MISILDMGMSHRVRRTVAAARTKVLASLLVPPVTRRFPGFRVEQEGLPEGEEETAYVSWQENPREKRYKLTSVSEEDDGRGLLPGGERPK